MLFSLRKRYLAREHQPSVEVKASWCVASCLPNSILYTAHIIQRHIPTASYILYLLCTSTHSHSLSYIIQTSPSDVYEEGMVQSLGKNVPTKKEVFVMGDQVGVGDYDKVRHIICIIVCAFLCTSTYFSSQSHMICTSYLT